MARLSRVLVVNAGSTSLKLRTVEAGGAVSTVESLETVPEVAAVGHRVVHGGEQFVAPTLIDADVETRLRELVDLAPLHNAPALDGMEQARWALPDVPHVAVFDTAFHRTLPQISTTLPLPERFRGMGVRRFGFHGTSVEWAASRVQAPRLVVCHLGGGSSVSAVLDGASIDTSMGFTPLDGVPMASRSGAIDPGALIYLLRHGLSADELDAALEHESGMTGLAGTADMRELQRRESATTTLAFEIYCRRVAQTVAAMTVSLGGLDAVVFTGGIGEGSAPARLEICRQLEPLGVCIDAAANQRATPDTCIDTVESTVAVHVITAREELVIAECVRMVVGI